MRAARAAATRGEVDSNNAFQRPFDYDTKPRSRRATSNQLSLSSRVLSSSKGRSSRSGVGPISRDHRASTSVSLRGVETKRIPRGSAAKRPRAFARAATAGGQALDRYEADSRFPMPYPGANRGLPQPGALPAARVRDDRKHHLRHNRHSDERELFKAAGPGRSAYRKVHRVESHGPRPAAAAGGGRRRTRPKSASVVRASAESYDRRKVQGDSQLPMAAVRQIQEMSKVSFVKEQGRIGGSKRPRPMSAPPARGAHVYREKRGGGKRNGEVLLALSHMADGSSCAPSELRIMKWVVLRETYLTKLQGVVSADRKRAKFNVAASKKNRTFNSSEKDHTRSSPQLFVLLTELLTVLRRITVEIVEAVEKWRRGDKNRAFIWGSSNYLLKAACDTEFLSRLPGLEQHLGVIVSRNPFLSHTCLDGRSAVLDRFSIRSRSGAFPLGDSGSLGVSEERMTAAAAVLFREIRRERRRLNEAEEERARSRSDERTRARSPSDRRRRRIRSPERRDQVEYGRDKHVGAFDKQVGLRDSEGRPKVPPSVDAAAASAGDAYNAYHPRRGDRHLDGYGDTEDRTSHDFENQLACEEHEQRPVRFVDAHSDDIRRGNKASSRKPSNAPVNTEGGRDPGPSEEPSGPLSYEVAATDDRQLSEERHVLYPSDDDRHRRAGRAIRRRSSTASDLTEAGSDPRRSQLPPRRSSPHNNAKVGGGSCRAPPLREEHNDQDMGNTDRDNRRATEVYRAHDSPASAGHRPATRADRRWSTGSSDPRCTQRGQRRSLPFYAVAQNDGDESQGLPPDDQSLDYQNGGILYRDQCYDENEQAAYRDDDQNLKYYYQEGGYYACAEVEHQEGYDTRRIGGTDRRFADQSNPAEDRTGSPNKCEQVPTDAEGYPSGVNSAEPQLERGASEPKDQQHSSEAVTEASAGLFVVPTGPLPPASEETRSCEDQDPPDRNHGRMGRRGSPFNLIFNMCDGMLTDLKGLGMGDRMGGFADGSHESQPSTLGDQAGMHNEGSYDVPIATGVAGKDDQEQSDDHALPVQNAKEKAPANDVGGRGTGDPPPPVLRGATYASLTRNIVAMSKEGWPNVNRHSSGGDGGDTECSSRSLADFFVAWAERTEGRLRYRDAKAVKHYRVGRLRHAMSAWEAHRATFLGSRMAEAFAGSFGLSSRFFVRFTFDALRAHAKGARVAARNRAVIGTFVSHMGRFGRARLRQAWRRWAPPIVGPGYWGEEGAVALENLYRHWGKGRLRAALDTWRRRQPRQHEPDSEPVRRPLHAAGSFATLKGKLKAVGSFATLKGAPATSTASKPKTIVDNGSRRREGSSAATNSKDEDSWAEWLGNEASISIMSPDGDGGSQRAAPGPRSQETFLAGGDSNAPTRGPPALSPSRSFRGLGVALKSIKSFRDGRDKSQTQRPRLRSTASFGSPPSPSSPSHSPPLPVSLDPATADSALQVIDGLRVQHFAANRTKLRGEAARLKAREDAAATIQRALWRAPRERKVAARVTRSALLIQELWRLRSQRRRAGCRLVRAWRARVRARVVTLNRALLEAAEEGDLRAVAFLLRPSTSTGAMSRLGLSVGFGGADANATAGTAKETALHAAASSGWGGRGKEEHRNNLPGRLRNKYSISGRSELSAAPWTGRAAERRSSNTSVHGSVDAHGKRSTNGNWLKGRGCSPDWVGVVRALVAAGAMIEARDGRGFTPMMTAAEGGSKETVEALSALGGEVDAKEARGGKRTPLVIAAQTANAPAAAALLEYGARVNLVIGDGLTPLHEAVGAGSTAVAEMLVRAGANVNATNESAGMTPLHLAVANDQHAAARLLVHSGANVCLPDSRGLTCLRLTVEMADAPTVALLLAAEPPADLSVKDENGGTVLHAACRLGLTDIAQLLLDHGSDPHVRDARGRTPELVALDLGHGDCAGLFYNVDIQSYAPNPSKNDRHGASNKDASVEGRRQERREDEVGGTSSSSSDGSDGGYTGRRAVVEGEGRQDDREQGGEKDEDRDDGRLDRGDEGVGEARTKGKLRESFDKAIAAARRASSASMKGHEDQAGPPEQRGEGSQYGNEYFEGAEGRHNGEGAWRQVGHGGEGEGDGIVETGGPEREWSKAEEWVHDHGNGDSRDDPAAQAAPAPQGDSYDELREIESSVDWQQAYLSASDGGLLDPTAIQHDVSYNQTDQGYRSHQHYSSGQGRDPSYDATDVETGNEISPTHQGNSCPLEPSTWGGYEHGQSVEMPQEEGAVDREENDTSNLWEASLGAARAPSGVGTEQHQQGEAFVVPTADDNGGDDAYEDAEPDQVSSVLANRNENDDNNGSDTKPEYSEGGTAIAGISRSDNNSVGGVGWGSAIALAKASSRWISLLDKSSGSVYYQNEQSGSTQWEAPEGAVVITAPQGA